MTEIRQRAKSPEQKALRRQQKLDAATGRFAQTISNPLAIDTPRAIKLLRHIQASRVDCWHIALPSIAFRNAFQRHAHWLVTESVDGRLRNQQVGSL